VTAEHVAQHGAQAAAELGDERVDLGAGTDEAGDRRALERDRLADARLQPISLTGLGADGREPL
jgi:hypothetical protein